MKKNKIVGLASIFAIVLAGSTTPAQANDVDTIAVIDTQFVGAQVGTNVTNVCLVGCSTKSIPKTASQKDSYNHGVVMAEVIRKANPSAHLVLIQAGSTNVGPVSSQGLNAALTWIKNNPSLEIDSVSVSLNAGNAAKCLPIGGVRASDVESNVNTLASLGVKIFAAAGNGSNAKQLDYPACIPNVIAVTIPNRNGTANANLDLNVVSNGNFLSTIGLVSSRTTSVATALAAANWNKIEIIPNVARQIILNVVN